MTVPILLVVLALVVAMVWHFVREWRGPQQLDVGRSPRVAPRVETHESRPLAEAKHGSARRPAETIQRVLTVEERVCRCSVCGAAFVLRYTRTPYADEQGDTVVHARWVRCGSPSCHHWEPVIVPINARQIHTREWLGSAQATPSEPTLLEIMSSSDSEVPKRP